MRHALLPVPLLLLLCLTACSGYRIVAREVANPESAGTTHFKVRYDTPAQKGARTQVVITFDLKPGEKRAFPKVIAGSFEILEQRPVK